MSPELLKTKAREICYALVRVSYYIKRSDLRQRLEGLAFQLLENTALATVDANDKAWFSPVLRNIVALDVLVRMGHSLYEIEPVNATILVRELDSFNSAIRQFGNLEEKLPNLETFFETSLSKAFDESDASRVADKSPVEINLVKAQDRLPVPLSEIQPQTINLAESDNGNPSTGLRINPSTELRVNGNPSTELRINPSTELRVNGNNGMKNLAIRQTALVNKIKASSPVSGLVDGCRLKDLMAEFPQVSERTLRYDLQRLAEQGIIERVGSGGPASYYRLRSTINNIRTSDVQNIDDNSGHRKSKNEVIANPVSDPALREQCGAGNVT